MKYLTKKQRAYYDKLLEKQNVNSRNIYAVVNNRNTPFSECYNLASDEMKDAYNETRKLIGEFESQMIAEGRAFRTNIGGIFFYEKF